MNSLDYSTYIINKGKQRNNLTLILNRSVTIYSGVTRIVTRKPKKVTFIGAVPYVLLFSLAYLLHVLILMFRKNF